MESEFVDLTQYVILREDLQTDGKPWPRGALIAQACHACISVNSLYNSDEGVIKYTSFENLPNLRTVVLSVENESSLLDYHKVLTNNLIKSHLFTEKPENIVTCLATVPIDKGKVGSLLKKLKTFK
uniref:peptidyl-tRNA hydrolase n=1 Tax=Theileria annulata TaxID=5874 RepID=A0A3B0NB54_THEAN